MAVTAQVFVAFAALPEGDARHADAEGEDEDEGAPVFLRRWGAHVNHFLGYFPYPRAKPVILPLVELRRSLAPCFAPLPAGGKGRAREGAPTLDDAPSPRNATPVAGGGWRGDGDGGEKSSL